MKKELEMERRTRRETNPWNNNRIDVHINWLSVLDGSMVRTHCFLGARVFERVIVDIAAHYSRPNLFLPIHVIPKMVIGTP